MKKLIILLLLILCSCSIQFTEPEKKVMNQNYNFNGDISEVEYKGHSYIIFEHLPITREGMGLGVIHDPDCHCTK